MLNVPAAFPQPGSWALAEIRGAEEAVRIVNVVDGDAIVSMPNCCSASGNLRLPVAQLLDPTPLAPAEKAEAEALERSMVGKSRVPRAKRERFEALTRRELHARRLAEVLDRYQRQGHGTPALREAAKAIAA